jgi:deoxycytidine triphosphate deaminase
MATQLLDIEPVGSDDEAATRAAKFKQVDPFPEIRPALLSAADIEDYARVTAMLHPFYPHPDALKPASYEVRPGRRFVRWNQDGKRIEETIRQDRSYELPANSIVFMRIEPMIRLPDYIALRFNLRIKHVHRGLLLGTGPLVDPGFVGNLLIPLHNLTSDAYFIQGDEGLIWIEFTKTSLEVEGSSPQYRRRGTFHSIEGHKTNVPVETYFWRANRNDPIRSSIPQFVRDAEVRARQASNDARRAQNSASAAERSARNLAGIYLGISALAILLGVLGFFQFYTQMQSNVQTTAALAGTIKTDADQAKLQAERANEDQRTLKSDLNAAEAQLADLRAELGRVTRELEQLRQLTPQAPIPASPSR